MEGMKAQNSKTMFSYFRTVSQIKEQLEPIGDMMEYEKVVMTTVNRLPRDTESFIRGISSLRKLNKF